MQDIYKIIEEYNLSKKRKILIVFDGMIADVIMIMIADMIADASIHDAPFHNFC